MDSRLHQMMNVAAFRLGRARPVTGPAKAFWEITLRCNSKCRTCDIWRKPPGDEMPTAEAKRVIDELAEAHVLHISWSGGETLMREDVLELIEHSHRRGIRASMNTNGSLIDLGMARRLADTGIRAVYLSLDGATPETHNNVRGYPRAYDEVLTAAHNLMRVRRERGIASPRLFFNMTVNRRNYREMLDVAALTRRIGMDGLTMTAIQNIEHYKPIPGICFEPDDWEELGPLVDRLLREHGDLLPHPREYFEGFEWSIKGPRHLYRYPSVVGFLTVMIHPNGDVFADPMAFEKVGNLRNRSFLDVWRSEEFDALRRRVRAGEYPMTWFDCVAPISVMVSNLSPLRFHRMLNRKMLGHLVHKTA